MADLKYNFIDNNFVVYKDIAYPSALVHLPLSEEPIDISDWATGITDDGVPIIKPKEGVGDPVPHMIFNNSENTPVWKPQEEPQIQELSQEKPQESSLKEPSLKEPELIPTGNPEIPYIPNTVRNLQILYILKYAKMAVDQMHKYHIPASITLALGILESASGTSYLANLANNHFGIKGLNPITGKYVRADDDKPNEKFRKYNDPMESYEDHSKFLVNNKRYQALFNLDLKDYKSWAIGLKAAGYATSPTYALKLIQIIEQYNLLDYDNR